MVMERMGYGQAVTAGWAGADREERVKKVARVGSVRTFDNPIQNDFEIVADTLRKFQ